MQRVTKAVFPVAGFGTRFLPATKASPKKMLPVVDKPLIQYAVEEAMAAGITEMIFQPDSLGLGHAVLCAETLVAESPFAVILADDLLHEETPVTRQLLDVYSDHGGSVIGIEPIARENSGSYGVVDGTECKAGVRIVRHRREASPSGCAVEPWRRRTLPADTSVLRSYPTTKARCRRRASANRCDPVATE